LPAPAPIPPREAIELTRGRQSVGADACLLVTPYYNRPSQRGLYEHFRAIAAAVDVPQMLYNVPSRTAVDLANDTTLRLAQSTTSSRSRTPPVIYSVGRELLAGRPEGFAVYSGDDGTAAQLILAGAAGNISVTANVVPALSAGTLRAALAGDASQRRGAGHASGAPQRALFVEANPMPVKYALRVSDACRPGSGCR
jgi:4-hydroxy-tetrahydrodipicolinate synthase